MTNASFPADPARTALLIVDLQNDFLAPDGAYARGGAVSAAAAALPPRVAAAARALKAAGGMVVASQFTLWPDGRGEPMIAPHLAALRPFLRKGDFAPGSRGQANVAELDGLVDVSVCKVAYSAFFNTQLDWVLRHAGIDTVAVCGIVTNGRGQHGPRRPHARIPRRRAGGRLRRLPRRSARHGAGRHGGHRRRNRLPQLRARPGRLKEFPPCPTICVPAWPVPASCSPRASTTPSAP